MRVRGTLGALGAGLVVTGCSAIGLNFKDPEVHLNRVIVRAINLSGGALDLQVAVNNFNSFVINSTKLQLGFDIEDSHVGDIDYENDFQVPKADSTILTLPVRFNWSGVGAAVRAALGYGDLPYTMKGQITLDTPFGQKTVPFTREGRAPLTRVVGVVPAPAGSP
ncbi:MAG TPA: LEA type 2 family protein [Gemmatimonadales bacterium]|jgi:LEA14-like dessication related protein